MCKLLCGDTAAPVKLALCFFALDNGRTVIFKFQFVKSGAPLSLHSAVALAAPPSPRIVNSSRAAAVLRARTNKTLVVEVAAVLASTSSVPVQYQTISSTGKHWQRTNRKPVAVLLAS